MTSAPSSSSSPPPGLKTSGSLCAASYCKAESRPDHPTRWTGTRREALASLVFVAQRNDEHQMRPRLSRASVLDSRAINL